MKYLKLFENFSFKEWFRSSKIVDNNGNPLLVYHGTSEDFTNFNKEYITKNYGASLGKGFYFTEIEDNAKCYPTKETCKKVIKAYLKIENPLIVNSVKEYREFVNNKRQELLKNAENIVIKNDILLMENNDILKKFDYDGIIYMFNGKMAEIVIFSNDKIKIVE